MHASTRKLDNSPPGRAGVDGAFPFVADFGGGGGGGGGVGAFLPSDGVALPPGVTAAFAAGLPEGGGGGGGGGGSEDGFLPGAAAGAGSAGARGGGGGEGPFLNPDGGGGGGGGAGFVAFAACRTLTSCDRCPTSSQLLANSWSVEM